MAAEWYYAKDDQQLGPLSASDLKALAKSGELSPSDLVWMEGMADWKPASGVKELFPAKRTTAPIQASPSPTTKESKLPTVPSASSADDAKGESSAPKAAKFSLLSTAKAAAQLAAKQAERTKLITITLPVAYLPLGRLCFASKDYEFEFSELHQQLDQVQTDIDALAAQRTNQPTANTLTEKAKSTANKTIQATQSQKLKMRHDSLLRKLGQAVYERYQAGSGSEKIVQPIQESLARLAALDADIAQLSVAGQGSWLTPKRLAIAVVVAASLFVLIGIGTVGRGMFGSGRSNAKNFPASSGDFVMDDSDDNGWASDSDFSMSDEGGLDEEFGESTPKKRSSSQRTATSSSRISSSSSGRGRNSAADEAVQAMRNAGTYTPEAESNIRDFVDNYEKSQRVTTPAGRTPNAAADEAIRSMRNAGTSTPAAENNIRDIMESYEKVKRGKK